MDTHGFPKLPTPLRSVVWNRPTLMTCWKVLPDLGLGLWQLDRRRCRACQSAMMHQGKSTLMHSPTHAEHVQLQEGGWVSWVHQMDVTWCYFRAPATDGSNCKKRRPGSHVSLNVEVNAVIHRAFPPHFPHNRSIYKNKIHLNRSADFHGQIRAGAAPCRQGPKVV